MLDGVRNRNTASRRWSTRTRSVGAGRRVRRPRPAQAGEAVAVVAERTEDCRRVRAAGMLACE